MRPWPEYVSVMVSLLAMCTAPALIPIFLGMTEQMSPIGRKKTAYGVSITVVIALSFMIFLGESLFKLMGISIDAFRVGGGVLIFLSSLQMVNSSPTIPAHEATSVPVNDPTIVPLAIPIVAGPGLLSAMLLQSTRHTGFVDDLILLAAALTIGIYVLVSFLAGESLTKLLGPSGLSVMTKISGLLLCAIAVEFIADGLKGLFPALG